MSQQIAVVAIVDAQPGTARGIEAAMRACILATRAESGCLSYVGHRDAQAADHYVFIERRDSQATGAAFESLGASLEVVTLQPLDD